MNVAFVASPPDTVIVVATLAVRLSMLLVLLVTLFACSHENEKANPAEATKEANTENRDGLPSPESHEANANADGSAAQTRHDAESNSPVLDDRAKQADSWIEKATKTQLPAYPTWSEMFQALERKYGKGQIPCSLYDTLREKFFKEFVQPRLVEEGYSISATWLNFKERTDLPTRPTLSGRQRVGCREDQ